MFLQFLLSSNPVRRKRLQHEELSTHMHNGVHYFYSLIEITVICISLEYKNIKWVHTLYYSQIHRSSMQIFFFSWDKIICVKHSIIFETNQIFYARPITGLSIQIEEYFFALYLQQPIFTFCCNKNQHQNIIKVQHTRWQASFQ